MIWYRTVGFSVAALMVAYYGEQGRYGFMAAWLLIGALWGALLVRSIREWRYRIVTYRG